MPLLSVAACDLGPYAPGVSANGSREAEAVTANPPRHAGRCGDGDYRNVRVRGRLTVMSAAPEDLERAWGRPVERERFRVGEPVGTFYGELGDRAPGPIAHAGAPAQTLTWRRNGCSLTVSFVETAGAYRVVNAFEWAVGADF